ncbi:hypothetical protein PYCCODRAFT_1464180 [Trametes coccinea BRFM310]|uniref:DUF1793-domain-containing protein n=1 Tax=Trametes coccinea (strain BRFM310) TaxID=1353009 RepID=A0A1Y2J0Y6_TRAC3|nr:hypothetical protein PYCCODRAFT_1464180 [Trametes coccinea BRFM310]
MSAWAIELVVVDTEVVAGLFNSWPLFRGNVNLRWAGKVRVDNQTYAWMGEDYSSKLVNATGLQITPTRSIFFMQAGPMNITVTFLSPIEPSDWVLQSLPFSYMSFEAIATDGRPHEVQVYSDISADWLSGDRSSAVRWSQNATNGSIYQEINLQSPQSFVEIQGQAQDGAAYYAMAKRDGLTWQIGQNQTCREQFSSNGSLANTVSTSFTPIESSGGDTVFAFAVKLGTIERTASPVTWSIGYVRNPTIQYTVANGSTQKLSPYFVKQYGNDIEKAIETVTGSYPEILQRAIEFDEAIVGNASKISSQYADLVSLALRQTMGALDFTVSTNPDGTTNASDVRVFMKDVNGNAQMPDGQFLHGRVNPVEKMYAAMPALLYVNASIIGFLLAPLLDAQDLVTDMSYAAQDIGVAYPNATGIRGPHNQGIEQTGNMLIMLYAHARFSGDGSLINAHYNLAKRWADYLVAQSLTPTDQSTADNQGGANMTNLAIKGIIGVKAMAEISRVLGESMDAQQYDKHAAALVSSWQSLATSTDQEHLLGYYGDEQSWTLMYNIYADRLLGTEIISQTLLQRETAFYQNLIQSAQISGSTPLDTVLGNMNSPAWELFTAAFVQDELVRDSFIEKAWETAVMSSELSPFSATYYTTVNNETIANGSAGPAVGAMYALLALNLPNMTISVSHHADEYSGNRTSSVGALVGGVVGAFGGLIFVSLCIFWSLRTRRQARRKEKLASTQKPRGPILSASPYTYSPPHPLPSLHDAAITTLEDSNQEVVEITSSLEAHATQDSVLNEALEKGPESDTIVECQSPSAPTFQDAPRSPEVIPASREPVLSGRDSPIAPPETRGGGVLPPTEVLRLQTQMEMLWRTVEEMRAERRSEPPPEYSG